jgi:colanic acid/amylovoran biosynthesis glycosyltransferase
MKVMYVTSSFPFGAGEVFIMPELNALQKMGHEVLVVPLRPHGSVMHEDAKRWTPYTLAVPLVSSEIITSFTSTLSRDTGKISQLARLFGKNRPHVALKNLSVWPKSAWLAQRASALHVDHIHAFWASTVATLAVGAAELSGIPWSFTAHRFDIVQANLLEEKSRSAQFIRFISESGLRMSGFPGTDLAQKAKVLHLGVDLRDRDSNVARRKSTVALCAASLIPVKAHAVLFDAVDRLRRRGCSFELWLAGDGRLKKALQLDVRRRGLEGQIKFLGAISHSALLNLYATRAVDIAVLASTDLGNGLHEGIPASLMEAMSFGVPVIGTNTGGIPELLAGAGLLVPPNDSNALSEALQLLSENDRLRESIGRAGRNRIQDSFSATGIAVELSRLFSLEPRPAVTQLG